MPISISSSPMVKVGTPAAGTVQGESATPMAGVLSAAARDAHDLVERPSSAAAPAIL